MKPLNIARKLKRRLVGPPDFVPYEADVQLEGACARFQITNPGDRLRVLEFGSERENMADMVRSVSAGDAFWDVGAYIGVLATLVARKARRVIAIEPDPGCHERLGIHARMNSLQNLEMIQCGLGDAPGELSLNTSGGQGDAPSFFEKNLKNRISVPVKRLDDLVAERPESFPTVLKIDVEGFEARVVKGGQSTLRDHRLKVLFLEVHPVVMVQNGESLADLFATVEQSGFRAVTCIARKNELHMKYQRVESHR
ncbi:FkbM family methyltransferase [Candidatus Sumerlaeota bacterium]|nr:FkbM family methyltransferase [Candidatus Sumerlaeota bacterium]